MQTKSKKRNHLPVIENCSLLFVAIQYVPLIKMNCHYVKLTLSGMSSPKRVNYLLVSLLSGGAALVIRMCVRRLARTRK